MFSALKNAYANLVAAINGHAKTIREADTKVRDLYGLDEPVNLLPPAEKEKAGKKAK